MMSNHRRFLAAVTMAWATVAALAIGAFASPAHAQTADADPPGRVARLSEFTGQVWLYRPDDNEWVAAVRNQPLTGGDRVATDTGARAELQIGSTTVRLDAASELELTQIDDDHAAMSLQEGSAMARVRDPNDAGMLEFKTDEGRFVIQRAGNYRLDRGDGRSAVTVYEGLARYEGPNSGMDVAAGQRAEFWIDSGGVAQYSTTGPVNDAFTAWSNDRDGRAVGRIAQRYVSPEMTGAAELDAYGRWEQSPEYGALWIPTAVAADWAPYSRGHWVWVRPWGWTWVDDAPWGFAPFHYGRWVHVRNTWCWTPGTRVRRPVYAPALVAWVGGPRVNVSVTVGGGPSVGWFPLAPREVYVPSYRVSPRYVQNVNITNVTNITQITQVYNNPQAPREYRNRSAPRAITVVPATVLAERKPVAPAAAELRQTQAVRELAKPGPTTAMLTPPVAAPTAPARAADARTAVRPPPGRAERPAGNKLAEPADRDRRTPTMSVPNREAQRQEAGGATRPATPTTQPAAVTAPSRQPNAAAAPDSPAVQAAPGTPTAGPRAPTARDTPQRADADRPSQRPDARPGEATRADVERPANGRVAIPAPPRAGARPAAGGPDQPTQAPPARRGDDMQTDAPRSAPLREPVQGIQRPERVSPAPQRVDRPEPASPAPQRVDRPAAVAPPPPPRRIEPPPMAAPAPVERPAAVRPVEVPRPIPTPEAAAPRAEPRRAPPAVVAPVPRGPQSDEPRRGNAPREPREPRESR